MLESELQVLKNLFLQQQEINDHLSSLYDVSLQTLGYFHLAFVVSFAIAILCLVYFILMKFVR